MNTPKFRSGNQVELLRSGAEYFPALIAAIDVAHSEIYFETYIYHDDPTGWRVTEALRRAVARGVTVRLTVDGFGSRDMSTAIRSALERAGVHLAVFRPDRHRWLPSRRRLRRLHRKLVLIDHEVALVGGINIMDDLADVSHAVLEQPRLDFAVRVRGPILRDIAISMMMLWLRVYWRDMEVELASFGRRVLELTRRTWPEASQPGVRVAFVMRDNFRHRMRIEKAYLRAIGHARREVIISNAYFLPGRRFRKALYLAARRGVRVCLLLQGHTEYPFQHHASQALYEDLLRAGIEIHEYRRSFLHAKVAVVDDEWATVGSSNIDPFSLLVAREANVIVLDRAFNAALRTELRHAIEHGAEAVLPEHHASRAWPVRAYNWFAYGVLRLAMMLSGYAGRY